MVKQLGESVYPAFALQLSQIELPHHMHTGSCTDYGHGGLQFNTIVWQDCLQTWTADNSSAGA